MNPKLRYLLLWRDIRISGVVFITGLIILTALQYYSVLVVSTCLAIPCMIITIITRLIFAVKSFLLKKPVENPFQYWLVEDWEISGSKMDSINRKVADIANNVVVNIKKKLLVEDTIDSIQGLFWLFVWYYIGKTISGMTLFFIGYVGLFTIPKFCEAYRRELDSGLKMLNEKYERLIENMPSLNKRQVKKSKAKAKNEKEGKDEKTA